MKDRNDNQTISLLDIIEADEAAEKVKRKSWSNKPKAKSQALATDKQSYVDSDREVSKTEKKRQKNPRWNTEPDENAQKLSFESRKGELPYYRAYISFIMQFRRFEEKYPFYKGQIADENGNIDRQKAFAMCHLLNGNTGRKNTPRIGDLEGATRKMVVKTLSQKVEK